MKAARVMAEMDDNGTFLRSEVVRDGRNVGDVAEEAKAEWLARGALDEILMRSECTYPMRSIIPN